MKEEVMVSICCIAYNHEKYISKAIESFLMQDFEFKYEILIHDDASTDRTAEIIKSYEKKYPELIRGIYQKENQYSKGRIVGQIVRNQAKGRYIAFCECDDYWTDPHKISEQFNFLENNLDYIAIGHWCDVVDENNNLNDKYRGGDKILNFEFEDYGIEYYKNDIIPAHINTIMYRNIYINHKYDYEKMYTASRRVGDRTTYLILSLLGKFKIIHKKMSCYRYINTGGDSYSSKIAGKNLSYEWFEYYYNIERFTKEVFDINLNLRKLRFFQVVTSINFYRRSKTKENKIIMNNILKKCDKKELIFYFPIAIYNQLNKRRSIK